MYTQKLQHDTLKWFKGKAKIESCAGKGLSLDIVEFMRQLDSACSSYFNSLKGSISNPFE